MLTAGSRKVVLFLPPYSGKLLGPPLGLLSLAGSLRAAGYIPQIIDGALDRDYMKTIAAHAHDSACLGVSLLTGPMILDAIEASKLFRKLRPNAPIIYGGWHPSLLTGETLREDFVDVVVRHQGEATLVEILRRIDAGQPLDLVPGCWFKKYGQIRMNADRPAIPLSSLPVPAYDLIDFDAYARSSGERKLPYATSTGCPYACNYCTDMVFYNRRFNAIDVDRVVMEITDLVKRYALSEVALVDSNFLVDVHRAVAIAEGFVRSRVRFRWTFQASTDLLCRMTDEEVERLAAGGVSHIGFGTESASPEVLELMNKRHQHIEDIREAVRKCSRAGIRVTLNLIFAYPGEEERHRRETLRTMGEIAARYDNVTFSPNLFTPYPGIPIWPELRARGLSEPTSLAEWADVDLGVDHLPWLGGRAFAQLRRGISYFLLANQVTKARRQSRSGIVRFLLALLRRPLHWRLQNYFFAWPWELSLAVPHKWLTVRRSLLTGQPLSHELSRSA
ncbi:MAG: B12-binding domain-containing radical SAM protein [Acidobacteriia bacterium]|nr:B12-binding domain-containing radical SAM protein [Terriglobia bacterium]